LTGAGGSRTRDDTVRETPDGRLLAEAASGWSHPQRPGGFGGSGVVLVWTDGPTRLPIASHGWHQGGRSKDAVALEVLRSARHRLRCQPHGVLCDAWYPATALRKRLRDSGWDCVGQVKKHWRCEGRPRSRYLQPPYWQALGPLAGSKGLW
jgi:hypothetical protein